MEGQSFQVPYPTTTTTTGNPAASSTVVPSSVANHDHVIQEGKWRHGLCDCFELCDNCGCSPENGCMFWQGWWCTPLLLGQLMQRGHLSPFGVPATQPGHYQNTYGFVMVVWIAFLVVFGIFRQYTVWIYYVLMALLITNVRYYVRRKYAIPASCCVEQGGSTGGCCAEGRVEDFCCGFWCTCCTVIQMARQTQDIREYPYQCCSLTGTRPGDPDVIL